MTRSWIEAIANTVRRYDDYIKNECFDAQGNYIPGSFAKSADDIGICEKPFGIFRKGGPVEQNLKARRPPFEGI